MKRTVYCGTYGKGEGNGIYRFFLEDGIMSDPVLFCRLDSAKYLADSGDLLASIFSDENGSGTALIDRNGNIVTSLIYEKVSGCHISCKDDMIRTANFHEGTFSFLKKNDNKLELVRKIHAGGEAGCHQTLTVGELCLGICMLKDQMFLINELGSNVRTKRFPSGSGPRHAVTSVDGKYLFVAGELSGKLYALETESCEFIDEIKLAASGKPAAVRLYDNRIYLSVRDADIICEIEFDGEKLNMTDSYSCGGQHPRDMIVVDGYVLCANKNSDSVTCLKDGRVTSVITVPQAVTLCSLDK